MDIYCLGYKMSFSGNHMWYYKVVIDNQEYLVVSYIHMPLMVMKLDDMCDELDDMIFSNASLSDKTIEQIEKKIKNTPTNDFELEKKSGEHEFFTKKIVKKEKAKTVIRALRTYTSSDVNSLLEVLHYYDEGRLHKITKKLGESNELLKDLVGYKFKYKPDGDHKTDGHMVGYTFTFVSPSGVKTELCTDMCLMVGWNYYKNLKIK